MILTIDIGNSDTVLGIYKNDEMINHWRVSTEQNKTADEYGILFNNLLSFDDVNLTQIKGIIISSVVPQVVQVLEITSIQYFNLKPMVVDNNLKTNMKINMEDPREVGADRIVNGIGGHQKFKAPLIIVDFGTATTFDYISEDGDYEGGAIAPGIKISIDALFNMTSKLPRVEIKKPKSVIAKNTVQATQSGIFYGFIGQVEKLIEIFKEQINDNPKVIATGGYSKLIGEKIDSIDHIAPLLTLDGLNYLAKINDLKQVSKKWRLQINK